jgi:hypothetical protein
MRPPASLHESLLFPILNHWHPFALIKAATPVSADWTLSPGGEIALPELLAAFHLATCAAFMTDAPSRFDDPEYWRRRAAAMRKIADGMAHLPVCTENLIRIDYVTETPNVSAG